MNELVVVTISTNYVRVDMYVDAVPGCEISKVVECIEINGIQLRVFYLISPTHRHFILSVLVSNGTGNCCHCIASSGSLAHFFWHNVHRLLFHNGQLMILHNEMKSF